MREIWCATVLTDEHSNLGRPVSRHLEPGWRRIGRIDGQRRRSLWIRETSDALELCAGREGDDAYVRITPENPQWRDFSDVLAAARFAAEYEDDDGLTLEREAAALSGGCSPR